MHYVYIIYSKILNRFYAGETQNVEQRLIKHSNDGNKFTGRSKDWKLIWSIELSGRTEAIKLERKIKKRGIKRFLEDIKFKI